MEEAICHCDCRHYTRAISEAYGPITTSDIKKRTIGNLDFFMASYGYDMDYNNNAPTFAEYLKKNSDKFRDACLYKFSKSSQCKCCDRHQVDRPKILLSPIQSI